MTAAIFGTKLYSSLSSHKAWLSGLVGDEIIVDAGGQIKDGSVSLSIRKNLCEQAIFLKHQFIFK